MRSRDHGEVGYPNYFQSESYADSTSRGEAFSTFAHGDVTAKLSVEATSEAASEAALPMVAGIASEAAAEPDASSSLSSPQSAKMVPTSSPIPRFRHLSALTSPLVTPRDEASRIATPRVPSPPTSSSFRSQSDRAPVRSRILRASLLESAYQEANHEVASRLVEEGVYNGFRAAAQHWTQEICADAEALQKKLVAEMEAQARFHEHCIAHHAAICVPDSPPNIGFSYSSNEKVSESPLAQPHMRIDENKRGTLLEPRSTECGAAGGYHLLNDSEALGDGERRRENVVRMPSTAVALPHAGSHSPVAALTALSTSENILSSPSTRGEEFSMKAQVATAGGPLHVNNAEVCRVNDLSQYTHKPKSQIERDPILDAADAPPMPHTCDALEVLGLALMIGGSAALLAIFRDSIAARSTELCRSLMVPATVMKGPVIVAAKRVVGFTRNSLTWVRNDLVCMVTTSTPLSC